MSNNNNIPSPEEWLASQGRGIKISGQVFYGESVVESLLASYAAHVAALVHRNTRHEVIEINNQHFFAVEGLHTAPELNQAIMNIPLRAVYPAPAGGATGNNDKQGACLHEWIHNPHRGTKYCRKGCDGFITHPAGEENREG